MNNKKKKREIKWNFSDTQLPNLQCPYCQEGLNVVHPETYCLLCPKHKIEFDKWHDKQVKVGNIDSWFKLV